MSPRLKRLVSAWLLAVLAFAQGSVVFAGCAVDRGDLARMLDSPAAHDCCDEGAAPAMPANECVNQATADLTAVGAPILIGAAPVLDAVLVVPPRSRGESLLVTARPSPPPPPIPPRILLHSFLI